MTRERVIYRETYKKGTRLNEGAIPELKHCKPGTIVIGADLLAAGVIERDGKQLEYHDLRVYLEPTP